jgi:hypothetical protein
MRQDKYRIAKLPVDRQFAGPVTNLSGRQQVLFASLFLPHGQNPHRQVEDYAQRASVRFQGLDNSTLLQNAMDLFQRLRWR